MPDFRGKVALVTGVGRAGQIGQAVARGFGRAGAKLVVADVNAAALAERARELADEGCDVRAVAGDLTGPEAARRAVATAREQFGGLDVVVNVAGGLLNYGSALDLKPRSEEHTSELQSQSNLVCRLLLEKKKKIQCTSVVQEKHCRARSY